MAENVFDVFLERIKFDVLRADFPAVRIDDDMAFNRIELFQIIHVVDLDIVHIRDGRVFQQANEIVKRNRRLSHRLETRQRVFGLSQAF